MKKMDGMLTKKVDNGQGNCEKEKTRTDKKYKEKETRKEREMRHERQKERRNVLNV